MKKFMLILPILFLTSTTAKAVSEKLYLIDMVEPKFESLEFNLMSDGLPGDFDAFGLKLAGKSEEDFSIQSKASNPLNFCRVRYVKTIKNVSVFKIFEDLEVDSGYTCEFEITYKNGDKAVLSLYSEGT